MPGRVFHQFHHFQKTSLFQSFVRQILLKGPARTAQGLHGLSVFGLEITQQPTCQGCFRRCLAGSSFEHTLPVHTYLQLYLPRNHIPQKPLCMHWIAYAARFLMTRDSLMDSGFFCNLYKRQPRHVRFASLSTGSCTTHVSFALSSLVASNRSMPPSPVVLGSILLQWSSMKRWQRWAVVMTIR